MKITINCAHHREASDVKLSALVEQGLLDVLLNDVGATVTIHICVLDQGLNVVDVATDLDTAASIGVLTWLDDPEGLSEFRGLVKDCRFVWVLCVVVELFELQELRIVEPLFDMVSEWQIVVILLADGLVVDLHVVEDCLFVAQVIVVLHLAVIQ